MSEGENEVAVVVVVEEVNAAMGVGHRVFEHHLVCMGGFVWEDLICMG